MSILYFTGWELGSMQAYVDSKAGWSAPSFGGLQTTANRQHRTAALVGGNYSMNVAWGSWCLAGTVVAGTARWAHYWARPNNYASRQSFTFYRSGTHQITVVLEGDGSITLWRGGTNILTLLSAYQLGIPHWIAMEVTCQDAGGIVDIWIDGIHVGPSTPTFTGDTKNHATLADWDQFGPGNGAYANNGHDGAVDDIFITDATTGRLTEQIVPPVLVPNSDFSIGLTPSTGVTNYVLVDDVPPVDTDYNSTAVSGTQDEYGFTDPPAGASITAVNVQARCTKDGALTQAEVILRSGATVVYRPAQVMPASPTYTTIHEVLDLDPDTAAAWTFGAVDALIAGCRFTT